MTIQRFSVLERMYYKTLLYNTVLNVSAAHWRKREGEREREIVYYVCMLYAHYFFALLYKLVVVSNMCRSTIFFRISKGNFMCSV